MKESTSLILLGFLLVVVNTLAPAPHLPGATSVILAIGLSKLWANK